VSIADRDWELAAIGERSNPRASGNRPATLRLDSSTSRAAGFAGCNRYNAGYVLHADSLSFTAPVSTRMACTDGMEVEAAFLGALTGVRTYEATDSTLVLEAQGASLMRFRRPQ